MQPAVKNVESERSEPGRGGRGFITVLLIIYLLFLAGLATWSGATQTPVRIVIEESPDEIWLVGWGKQLGCTALRDLLLFFPLGFLIAGALGRSTRSWGLVGLLQSLILGVCISLGLALAVRVAISGLPPRRPTLHAIMFAAVCCGLGCWAGATWVRARGAVSWLVGQVFLLVICALAVVGGFAWYGLEVDPVDIPSTPLRTEDRRRLANLFRENNPRKIKPGETAELTLTAEDLNQLLSWGLTLVSKQQKARVEIEPRNVSVAVSAPLPPALRLDRFLNITISGDVFAEHGKLGITTRSLRIGKIQVPPSLLAMGGPSILNEAWHNKHTRPFLTSMKDIQLADGSATVTYGHMDVSAGFVRDALVDLGGMQDMGPATAAHVQRLIERAEAGELQSNFGSYMQSAFEFARERSMRGDPVQENRAAILALGYLVGHYRIKTFVGPEIPSPPSVMRSQIAKMNLRGRNDWVRHFTVSAALAVLANVATSDAVGLLKEELDADGGSGFSFPDLLADRAGTTFAQRATANRESALAMQKRVASGFDVDAHFPTAADLPEGLTDAQLNSQFGGVGGQRYQEVVDEIERRIAACEANQDPP